MAHLLLMETRILDRSAAAYIELWPCGSAFEFELEMLFHCQPFGRNHRKNDGIAQAAVGIAHVIAQNAILFRAQSLDRTPAGMVEEARTEFDRDTCERLEGITIKSGSAEIESAMAMAAPFIGFDDLVEVGIRDRVRLYLTPFWRLRDPCRTASGTPYFFNGIKT